MKDDRPYFEVGGEDVDDGIVCPQSSSLPFFGFVIVHRDVDERILIHDVWFNGGRSPVDRHTSTRKGFKQFLRYIIFSTKILCTDVEFVLLKETSFMMDAFLWNDYDLVVGNRGEGRVDGETALLLERRTDLMSNHETIVGNDDDGFVLSWVFGRGTFRRKQSYSIKVPVDHP